MNVKRLKQQLALLLVFLLLLGNSAISIAQSLEVAPETDAPVEAPAEDADGTEPADEPAPDESEEELPPVEEPATEEDSLQEVAEPEAEPVEEELIEEELNDEEPIGEDPVEEEPIEEESDSSSGGEMFTPVRFEKTWDMPEDYPETEVTIEVYNTATGETVASATLKYDPEEPVNYLEWYNLPYGPEYSIREIHPRHIQPGELEVVTGSFADIGRETPQNSMTWNKDSNFFVIRPTQKFDEIVIWTLYPVADADKKQFVTDLLNSAPKPLENNPPLKELEDGKHELVWIHGPIASYDVKPDIEGEGLFTVKVTYDKSGKPISSHLTFDKPNDWTMFTYGTRMPDMFKLTNNYYEAYAKWQPVVNKNLEGRRLEASEFTFELTRDDDPAYKQLKQNEADGTVTFDDIEFSLEDVDKTITFSIKEVIPVDANNGITYDTNIYTVKVTVSDNEDGTLNLEFEYPDESDEITFVNVYNATGSWTPKATKNLVGRDIKDGEFTFELYRVIMDEFGNRYPTLIDTATNNDKGEVVFKEITYSLMDAFRVYHYYEIKEKEGTLPGVAYDPKVIRITNMLNDLGDGTIEVKTDISGELVFNNKYVATGKWDPMVSKTLTGRDLVAGEFSFVLKQDSKVLQTKTNAADGKVVFDAIEFNLPGTYEFELSEIKGDAFGVTYDETIHKITVVTTDNGDGTLKVTPSYDSDGVVFKNAFQVPKIDVTATKKWVGGPKEKPVIQLQLYRDGKAFGNVVELDGVTSYTWKDLDKTDVTGKDYKYTVKETVVPNYYEATYSDDGLTVTNTWTKKELPKTGMGSNLPLLIGGLSLVMGAGFVLRRRKVQ